MMAAVPPSELSASPRTSRYRRHATPQISAHFLGPGHLVALCVAMIVLALMLFPKAFIRQHLQAEGPASATTIAYLELLLRAQPGDRTIRLQLVRERLRAGQLTLAERELAPLVQPTGPQSAEVASLWLSLRRAEFVALTPGSVARQPESENYAEALSQFGKRLAPADQLGETRKATAAGLYVAAAQMAWQLLSSTTPSTSPPAAPTTVAGRTTALQSSASVTPFADATPYPGKHNIKRGLTRMIGLIWSVHDTDRDHANTGQTDSREQLRQQAFEALLESQLAAGHPLDALRAAQAALPSLDPQSTDWAQLIRIAVWADQPAAAGEFAQHWLASARDDATRWTAFHALIDSLLAANRPVQALAAASSNLDRMPRGSELWRLMTRLAMQAGDAHKSAEYARLLVHLDPVHGH